MNNMKNIMWVVFILLLGCDNTDIGKLNSVAKSINDKATELKESIDPRTLSELQNKFTDLKNGLDSKDVKVLKARAGEIDRYLGSRIWRWYVDIYEANAVGGVTAAKNEIKSILKFNSTKKYERDALDAINKGLTAELGLQNRGVLESVAVQSLRSKFGDNVTDVVITVVLAALVACRHGC